MPAIQGPLVSHKLCFLVILQTGRPGLCSLGHAYWLRVTAPGCSLPLELIMLPLHKPKIWGIWALSVMRSAVLPSRPCSVSKTLEVLRLLSPLAVCVLLDIPDETWVLNVSVAASALPLHCPSHLLGKLWPVIKVPVHFGWFSPSATAILLVGPTRGDGTALAIRPQRRL